MAKLTMLNSMASPDFTMSLQRQRAWNIEWLDLRDAIYGKRLGGLDRAAAEKAQAEIAAQGLRVFCLSTSVFYDQLDKGEAHFRRHHLGQLTHVLSFADVLAPKLIRLNGARLPTSPNGLGGFALLMRDFPWAIDVYREAIDRVRDAGFMPTIENEAGGCFLAAPADFVAFFDALDRKGNVQLTWDVQNHWACGVYPTLAVYEKLRQLIGYFHVKGGQAGGDGRTLAWNSALEDASWPVLEITQRVVDDGISPIICLNPPQHGAAKPDYDYASVTERDLRFLRAKVRGIEA
jgi:sugar phosphate isomerase/epimerase